MNKPTTEINSDLQEAFDFFNVRIFDGSLPQCMIVLQRKKNSKGYFTKSKIWGPSAGGTADNMVHEIAINPEYIIRPDREVISTLVHEQVHLWQEVYGNPGRGRYHNAEWADKMESIGLMPTSTGEPGGKRTGDRVTHFIIEGGLYDTLWLELEATDFQIRWKEPGKQQDAAPAPRKKTRYKYTCQCENNLWAKPGLRVMCPECEGEYVQESE